MCKKVSAQKKAIAMAQATGGMVWAAYEQTDYGRDMTAIIIQKKDEAASFRVTDGGEFKFEKKITNFAFVGYNALKRTFNLPMRFTFVEPCYC